MNKPKITFGSIKLNINKPAEEEKTNQQEAEANSSGFGTFGTFNKIAEEKSNVRQAIEDIEDDLETEQIKNVMGFSGFERKSKNFDINEMMKKAKENAPKPKFLSPAGEDEDSDDEVIGPVPTVESKKYVHLKRKMLCINSN